VWYIVRKVASGVATLIVVTVVVFAGLRAVPGTYAETILGPYATHAERAEVIAQFGLDRPLPVQYFDWAKHLASGDLGVSMTTDEPVTQILAERFPVTLELTLLALVLMLLVGLPLAVMSGMARGRRSRSAGRLAGAMAMGTPDFVTGSVLLYLFSRYKLGLTVGEYVPFTTNPVASIESMLLPAITIAVFGSALVVRTGRDSIASVLNQPYVTAARSRGETTPHVLFHHVIRNAAIPVLTVVAVTCGNLMGGAVISENLFSLPGLGQEVLTAINERDYAVVESIVLIAAAAFIFVNIVADVSYAIIDPRLRRGSR
jgi:peptide/nickel transport system permease protein